MIDKIGVQKYEEIKKILEISCTQEQIDQLNKEERELTNLVKKAISKNPYENENLEEIKQFTKGDIAVSNCFMRSGVLPGLVINRKYMDLAKIPLNEIIYPQVFSAIHVSLNADMFLVSSASKIVKIDYFSNFNIEDRSADRPGDYGVFERIFYIRENYKMNLVSKSVYYSNLKALFIWSKNVWKLKNSFESQKAYSFYKELIRSREVVRNRHFLKLYFMDTIIREDVSYLLKFKYFFSTFYYLIFSKEIRR